MTAAAYEARNIDRVARALYDVTKTDEHGRVLSWPAMIRHAETDPTARKFLNHWYALAIAAIDMTLGARERLRKA